MTVTTSTAYLYYRVPWCLLLIALLFAMQSCLYFISEINRHNVGKKIGILSYWQNGCLSVAECASFFRPDLKRSEFGRPLSMHTVETSIFVGPNEVQLKKGLTNFCVFVDRSTFYLTRMLFHLDMFYYLYFYSILFTKSSFQQERDRIELTHFTRYNGRQRQRQRNPTQCVTTK